MIYTLIVDGGVFGVNRDFRRIDLAGVAEEIATVQWDTDRQTGVIEYTPGTMDEVPVRDLNLEREDELAAKAGNKRLDTLKPRYKLEQVHRPRTVIDNFRQFEPLVALWHAAKPVEPEPEPEPEPRKDVLGLLLQLLRDKGVLTNRDLDSLK